MNIYSKKEHKQINSNFIFQILAKKNKQKIGEKHFCGMLIRAGENCFIFFM